MVRQGRSRAAWAALAAAGVLAGAAAVATRSHWLPWVRTAVSGDEGAGASLRADADHDHGRPDDHDHADDHDHEHADEHAEHADEHAGHSEATSIELSPRALANIGFEPFEVGVGDFARNLSLPAVVVEIPGRSAVHITAPLTGIVEKIDVVQGEAVEVDQPLFQLRLTHEELVSAQREYLETLARLGVVERELERLAGLGEGVVAGTRILEQQYERDRLQVALDAAQQAMLLHGLSERQVDEVRTSGRMLRDIVVRAPGHADAEETGDVPHLFTVQKLTTSLGAHVELGAELALLGDHCELMIEAIAFEDDAATIRRAAAEDMPVAARQLDQSSPDSDLTGLEIVYVAGQIDPESRAFKAYARLPNRIALDKRNARGKRYLEWAYKPGQRMELSIPSETWQDQMVLPATAVVDEGAEAYVYRRSGDHFDRIAVHVLYRDRSAAVLANDGALAVGDVVAGAGAYQLHLALKNKSGGAIDPHAGHNH